MSIEMTDEMSDEMPHGEGIAYPLPGMHTEDGEQNGAVGGENHQQTSNYIHTSKSGQDAFIQVCIRT